MMTETIEKIIMPMLRAVLWGIVAVTVASVPALIWSLGVALCA